jgi:hypothetical protein
MSSPRQRQQLNKINTKYNPDSTELRNIIDKYIEEVSYSELVLLLFLDNNVAFSSLISLPFVRQKSSLDGTSLSNPVVGIDNIGDLQTYIMETNPSWNVPEKRRLQKFVKRAISNQSPSTPSSQQSELTSESTNNEMDNRSERSRSSRLKGITNRLFGGGNSTRKTKSDISQPPMLEIQTTTKIEANNTEEFFTEAVTTTGMEQLPVDGTNISEPHEESATEPDAEATIPIVPETKDDRISEDVQTDAASREVDEMYSDDNDGKIQKRERCCFLWFC